MKPTRDSVRGLIAAGARWLCGIVVWRVATMMIYIILFSSGINVMVDYDRDTATARVIVVLMSFVSFILFLIFYHLLYVRGNGAERRRVLGLEREPDFSALRFTLFEYWPLMAVKVALLVLTQSVFCGFFAAFGWRYTIESGSTMIERLHIADAGWYLVTGNAALGLLLNAIFSAILLCAAQLLIVKRFAENK